MQRLLFILIILFAAAGAAAQPRVELRLLKPNTPDYYYYQLYFATFCGDSVIYDLRKNQLIFEVEGGRIDSTDYQIDRYAAPDRNSCYDLVLAFDNSSTVGADLPSVVQAGRALIDTMSKSCDYASIISFDDRPTLRTFLTNDRDELRTAVDAMAVSGRRALYDGISAGITTLYTSGTARVQAVLAFTTGNDNSSGRSLADLLEDVSHYGVRVFIVAMGPSISDEPLRTLCSESGGVYWRVNSVVDLAPLYRDFAGFIQREYDEHRITRRAKDVSMQDLLVRMRLEACGDSSWSARVFNQRPVVSVNPASAPMTIELGQSYPNPVSREAELHFRFSLAAQRDLRLELFDMLGRRVATIVEGTLAPGAHTAKYSPAQLHPGIYFYRLSTGTESKAGKLTVIE